MCFQYRYMFRHVCAVFKEFIHQIYNLLAYHRLQLNDTYNEYTFVHGLVAPSGPGPPHYRGIAVERRRTTFGRTPLDE
jgi:hypothetical protein